MRITAIMSHRFSTSRASLSQLLNGLHLFMSRKQAWFQFNDETVTKTTISSLGDGRDAKLVIDVDEEEIRDKCESDLICYPVLQVTRPQL